MHVSYNPPPSLVPFLTSEKFIALQVGPVGSTKTTAGIMKIAYHAKRMAPCLDGIRRSRAIWVRRSRQMLFDTSIKDFQSWYPPNKAGDWLKTEATFILRFDDVECEVLFRPMEDESDINRLLSLQGSFAIFDEFREISPAVFEAMQGRLGRYPDKRMVPPRPEWGVDSQGNPVGGCVTDDGRPNKHLWGMSNPPDAETYWEEILTNPPENVDPFFQPSGLSPEADWLQYLPDSYYEDLAQGKSQEYIDVYIHSLFGRSLSGKPVFPSFDRNYHVAKAPLRPIISQEKPLIIGMDFGLTPACTINQQDMRGRFLTFAEITSENMGIQRFLIERLKPLLADRFPGHPVLIIGDPAGAQRSQTDERSVFEVIRSHKFKVIPARTNSIAARISAVEGLLAGQVDGGARHLIDPSCKSLIRALSGGYRYKIKKSGEMEDSPEKNQWSHIADSHEYACLHVDANFGTAPRRRWQGSGDSQKVPARAWT